MTEDPTTKLIPCACGCGTMIPEWDPSRKRRLKYAARSHNHKRQDNALFWEKVRKTESCWIWEGAKRPTGHSMITIDGITRSAHHRSWEIHNGPIPEGMCVLHDCPGGDNPSCVNPAHLWLGTREDNNKDRARKGRNGRGDGSRKLNPQLAARIRLEAKLDAPSIGALAREYNVSRMAIARVLRNKTWRSQE
jgi:HNH endonuclease